MPSRSATDVAFPIACSRPCHYRGYRIFVAIGLAQDDGERVLPLVKRHAVPIILGTSLPHRNGASVRARFVSRLPKFIGSGPQFAIGEPRSAFASPHLGRGSPEILDYKNPDGARPLSRPALPFRLLDDLV